MIFDGGVFRERGIQYLRLQAFYQGISACLILFDLFIFFFLRCLLLPLLSCLTVSTTYWEAC